MKNSKTTPVNGAEKDFSLIRAFLAGESDAFDQLVRAYQNRIFNTCYRMLGDYHEANDSAQDIFVKVFRSLKKFRFRSSFSTWIYRITINTCRNKLRSAGYRRRREAIRLANPLESEEGSYSPEIGDDESSPARELARKERGAIIQEAINSLPGSQRMVVVLRDIDGFTYEEIASLTGFKPGTVKSKLARARRKLRNQLSPILSE